MRLEIADLPGRAEAAGGRGEADSQALPKPIKRSAALRAEPDAARQRLEGRTKACAAAERADHEVEVAARGSRRGRAWGNSPKPGEETPGPDEQRHLSDVEGSPLTLGARVSQGASGRTELGGHAGPAAGRLG
jgi:hypothetical protein